MMQTILGKLFFLVVSSSWLLGYHFNMQVDNPHPLLGEKTILSLHFSYDNLEEYEIEEPHFEHFSIKPIEDKEYQDEKDTWHVLLRYELIAQKVGTFTLSPLNVHIEIIPLEYQHVYNKNKYLQKQDIQTNPLTINVEPLPHSLKIIGDYTLLTSVDKEHALAGEPIVFNVHLKGEGNLDNLDFLTLDIPDVMVYPTHVNTYEKKFTLIASHNFTIPPIQLKYVNQKTKEVSLLSSDAFFITIASPKNTKQSYTYFWIYHCMGLYFLLLSYTYMLFKELAYINKKAYFRKQLKQTKDKEELLNKVAPYMSKNKQLTRLIYKLEEVEVSKFKALKKEILRHF
jgi:hypothetical protein